MRASRLLAAGLLLAGAGTAGCAHESAAERQLASMRDEISKVQADRDRFEQRVNALEVMMTTRKAELASVTPKVSEVAPMATPKLRVVRVNPDGSEEGSTVSPRPAATNDDPEDPSPRPVLRINGASERPQPGRKQPRPGVFEGTMSAAPTVVAPAPQPAAAVRADTSDPPTGRPSVLDPEAKRAFDAALGLVNTRKYPQAIDAFAAFLVKWPDHPYADNAFYFRGESYLVQGDVAHAIEQYEGLLARFPSSNKVPDTLLKLGTCYLKLGNKERARSYLSRLSTEFPRSEPAGRIPKEAGL